MSFASKVTLGASVVFCGATIYFVHWDHMQERERMRKGVLKDMARQAEQSDVTKVAMLTKQSEIEKQLKKERAEEKRQAREQSS